MMLCLVGRTCTSSTIVNHDDVDMCHHHQEEGESIGDDFPILVYQLGYTTVGMGLEPGSSLLRAGIYSSGLRHPQGTLVSLCSTGICQSRMPAKLWVEVPSTVTMAVSKTKNALVGGITDELWSAHVLHYCDLPQLVRLAWTCQRLRSTIQKVDFVVDWQENCHYMKRQCRCARHQFYLDIGAWCPFTWELFAPLVVENTEDLDAMLLNHRRSLRHAGLRLQRPHANHAPLTYLDPKTTQNDMGRGHLFVQGGYHAALERNIVPLPRMVDVPVEDALVVPVMDAYVDHDPLLTVDQKRSKKFWRTYHEVTEEDKDVDRLLRMDKSLWRRHTKHAGFDYRLATYGAGHDPVRCYLYKAKAMGERDVFHPSHPQLQMDLQTACQWARVRMTKTAVSRSGYNMDLCLRRDQMPTLGANNMSQLLLDAGATGSPAYEPDLTPLRHRGCVYLDHLRYTHEAGDFVSWALATESVLQTYYYNAWYDAASDQLHRLSQYTWNLAHEVQMDMRQEVFSTRWMWLMHVDGCENCYQYLHGRVHGGVLGTRDDERDMDAIDMLRDPRYRTLRVILDRSAMYGHVHIVTYLSFLL